MYNPRYLFLMIFVFTMSSCDLNKAEDEVLLRTDSFSNDSPEHVERWVFISNQNGKLLDVVKPDATSGIIEFKGISNNLIMLTELSVATFEIGNETHLLHNIKTYMAIPAGSSYIQNEETSNHIPFPDPVGKATITLKNYHGSDEPWSSIGFSDGYANFNNWLDYDPQSFDGSTFIADMNLREEPIDVFITSYIGSDPIYSWLRDVKVGDSLVVEYESFTPLIPVTINKPVTHAYIHGNLEPGNSGKNYILSSSEYLVNSNHYNTDDNLTLGYTDEFAYYTVFAEIGQVLCCQPHERVNYRKVGTSVPSAIHLPDYTFSVENGNLFNLTYSFDRKYTRKNLYFSEEHDNNTLWWFFHSPEGVDVVVPDIPAEILAQYPFLIRDNLPLSSVSFYDTLDGFSYLDYIKNSLEKRGARNELEQIQYYFQF
tara:strand:+ start:6923 stop:8203 length:1281 start_codon:yes stop_codon:yes gene_type:complete